MRSNNPRKFLSPAEKALVEQAITQAELRTSAEIKFVIARYCWSNIRDKAARVFKKFGLHRTGQRNCVLILLVTANREFYICGDRGIHEKAGQAHWDEVRDRMAEKFRQEAFAEGIAEAAGMIGQKLAQYFPRRYDDINEISDEVDYQQ